VAVSTAIWAGVVMVIGINYGPRMEAFLNVHRVTYWVWAGVVLVMIGVIAYRVQKAAPARQESA
jgi:membrane protein DedA with SNARE-associated domain